MFQCFLKKVYRAFFIAVGVIVFVFMGYEHVVFNAGLYAGMIFIIVMHYHG